MSRHRNMRHLASEGYDDAYDDDYYEDDEYYAEQQAPHTPTQSYYTYESERKTTTFDFFAAAKSSNKKSKSSKSRTQQKSAKKAKHQQPPPVNGAGAANGASATASLPPPGLGQQQLSPAPPSSAVDPRVTSGVAEVRKVLGFGFTEQEITNALKVSNLNAESAISYLLDDSREASPVAAANSDADAIFDFEDGVTATTSTASPRPLYQGTAASASSTNGAALPSKQSLSPKGPVATEPVSSSSSSSLSEFNKQFPPHLSSSSGVTSTASSPGPQQPAAVDEATLKVSFSGLAMGDAQGAGVQRFQFDSPSPDDVASKLKSQRLKRGADKKKAQTQSANGTLRPSTDSSTAATRRPQSATVPRTPIKKVLDKRTQLRPHFEKSSVSESPSSTMQASGLKPFTDAITRKRAAERTRLLEEERLAHESPSGDDKGSAHKPLINMIVCGHVDAGKSTMMGHLLHLMGRVSQKQMHKNQKESKEQGKASFAFAWVLDAHEEERSRGITVDVGMSYFETEHRSVVLLDSPGHRDFIPNMLSGASQADVGILVVDAIKGEFESGFQDQGQTKEHAILLRSLGVTQLIVAVNKMDAVEWSQERFKDICEQLKPFLRAQPFKDKNVTYVPVSGLSGENLVKHSDDARLLEWYKGPPLIHLIDKFKPPSRATDKPLRFSVSDVFRSHALGNTVSGKIESGSVMPGDRVMLMPLNTIVSVKNMRKVEGGGANTGAGGYCKVAGAGDNLELGLQNLEDINMVTVGQILCDPAKPVPILTRFRARIVALTNLRVPLLKGSSLVMHVHNVDRECSLRKLHSLLDKTSGEVVKKSPRQVFSGQSAIVDISCAKPVCLEVYKEFKQLGRFMLRRQGATVAVGIVTEILK